MTRNALRAGRRNGPVRGCIRSAAAAILTLQISVAASAQGPASAPDPVAAAPAPHENAGADPRDLLFASPTRLDHIGRIVAPVMIDGKGPFRFIVDTGATHSTISPSLAASLGLNAGRQPEMVVNGITGTARVPSVLVESLKAGNLAFEHTRLPVVWAPLMAGADGILGVAGIRNTTLFVDFQHNRVTISRSRHAGDWWDTSTIPAAIIGGGLMSVAGRVGGVRVRAIIDTGSERTIGNLALRDALYARGRADSLPRVTNVYGATTDVSSGQAEIAPTIRLGPVKVSDVTVVYGGFHIFDVWGMTTRPTIIIGMDVLGTVDTLGIDFNRAELYLETAQHVEPASAMSDLCRTVFAQLSSACDG
jgi:predicted aspartyl protease